MEFGWNHTIHNSPQLHSFTEWDQKTDSDTEDEWQKCHEEKCLSKVTALLRDDGVNLVMFI